MNDDQLKKKIAEANKFMRHELSHNTKNPPSTQKSGYKSLLSVVDPASMDNKQDDNESILSHAHSSPGTIRHPPSSSREQTKFFPSNNLNSPGEVSNEQKGQWFKFRAL